MSALWRAAGAAGAAGAAANTPELVAAAAGGLKVAEFQARHSQLNFELRRVGFLLLLQHCARRSF